jgi:hypothetical protein
MYIRSGVVFWCLNRALAVIFFQLNTHHHEGGVVFNLLDSHL